MSEASLVDTLKEHFTILDIVELIGAADGRKGMKILCPIHDEANPSCHLYVGQDRFQCFSCGAGGDQIDLFAQSQGLPLAQAIAALSTEAGLDWNAKDWGPSKPRPTSPAQHLLEVAAKAHLEVLRALERDHPETKGKEAWVSLVEEAMWYHDQIIDLWHGTELQPETAIDLMLIWWRWWTGKGAKTAEMHTLLSRVGGYSHWKAGAYWEEEAEPETKRRRPSLMGGPS